MLRGRSSGSEGEKRPAPAATPAGTPTPSDAGIPTPAPGRPRLAIAEFRPNGDHVRAFTVSPGGADRRVGGVPFVGLDQYSPRSDLIVYHKRLPSAPSYLYSAIAIARSDGSGERLLTTNGFDIEPRLSPDGRLIAFAEGMKGNRLRAAIMRVDGTRIATVEDDWNYGAPEWAPDGSAIAFPRRFKDLRRGDIVVIRFTGPARKTVLVATDGWQDLAWSPDGRFIAGVRAVDGTRNLWLIPLDGSQPSPLTKYREQPPRMYCGMSVTPKADVRRPAWSPDSREIAFESNELHRTQRGNRNDIFLIDVHRRNKRLAYASPPEKCTDDSNSIQLLGWTGDERVRRGGTA